MENINNSRSNATDAIFSSIEDDENRNILNIPQAVVGFTLNLILLCIGIFGNGLHVWCFLRNKTLKVPANIFVVAHGIIGLLFQFSQPVLALHTYIDPTYEASEWICANSRRLGGWAVTLHYITAIGVAMHRYFALVKPNPTSDINTWKYSIILCLIAYGISVILQIVYYFVLLETDENKITFSVPLVVCHNMFGAHAVARRTILIGIFITTIVITLSLFIAIRKINKRQRVVNVLPLFNNHVEGDVSSRELSPNLDGIFSVSKGYEAIAKNSVVTKSKTVFPAIHLSQVEIEMEEVSKKLSNYQQDSRLTGVAGTANNEVFSVSNYCSSATLQQPEQRNGIQQNTVKDDRNAQGSSRPTHKSGLTQPQTKATFCIVNTLLVSLLLSIISRLPVLIALEVQKDGGTVSGWAAITCVALFNSLFTFNWLVYMAQGGAVYNAYVSTLRHIRENVLGMIG